MIRLLVATKNPGKLRELQQLLRGLPFDLLTLKDFPSIAEIAETGITFAENATLKAAGYAKQAAVLTIADDSGLEVDALQGAPGIFSARYAGEGAPDSAKKAKLLAALEGTIGNKRSARFVSAVAIADSAGRIVSVSQGVCEGAIAICEKGVNGFGYDSVFIPQGYDLTFAELEAEVKDRISHRLLSLKAARDFLVNLTLDCDDG